MFEVSSFQTGETGELTGGTKRSEHSGVKQGSEAINQINIKTLQAIVAQILGVLRDSIITILNAKTKTAR